jgi:hypothetical protein
MNYCVKVHFPELFLGLIGLPLKSKTDPAMNTIGARLYPRTISLLTGLTLFAVLVFTKNRAVAAEDIGTIIGTVSSSETRNMLQGATVRLPGQERSVVTDNTGRFVLRGVPWSRSTDYIVRWF